MVSELVILFINSAVTRNIVLVYFLGICSYVALSKDPISAVCMGLAVTAVNLITSIVNWLIHFYVLVPLKLETYQYLVFILSISFIVQILELILDHFLPNLYETFGIYLPLITVNCTIFGTSLFVILRDYNLLQCIVFALGTGIGWLFAIFLLATIHRNMIFCNTKPELGHIGTSLLISGIITMAFSCLTNISDTALGK